MQDDQQPKPELGTPVTEEAAPTTEPSADTGAPDSPNAPDSTDTSATPIQTPSEPNRKPNLLDKLRVHKKQVILVSVLALIVVGVGLYLTVFSSSKPEEKISTITQRSLLGAETLIVDGTAEYSTDGDTWKSLKAAQKLEEGDQVRSASNGRVVINLDDGSAIRLNSDSALTLTSLESKSVIITNDGGEVYTRVVESDRSFNVKIDDETYTALGTAYKTISRDDVKGVEVYQSDVSVKVAKQTVTEGKRYYQSNPTPEVKGVVTDIPLDQLQKDDFLKWNLEQDKASDEFKDKLGYLATLEKTPAPSPEPVEPKPSAASAGIVLSGTKSEKGVSLSWKVTGLTVSKGFKVVKGTSANPTYGKQSAMFVEASARSTTWKITDGKTYNFRICIYNQDGSCSYYSNNVAVTTPYVAPPPEPTGSLSLSPGSGNSVSWVLSGSAPYGYKLVWATSPNHPSIESHLGKKGYDASATSGTIDGNSGSTYNVRVCMYYEGSCMNYSNEISVTLP